jgi:hypothetical protein
VNVRRNLSRLVIRRSAMSGQSVTNVLNEMSAKSGQSLRLVRRKMCVKQTFNPDVSLDGS